MTPAITPAISIVVYDPSGQTTGQTYPLGSVWKERIKPAPRRKNRRSLEYKQAQMAKRAKRRV